MDMNTAEFLRAEAAKLGPSEAELDSRAQELLATLEFCLMMRQMWGQDEPV